MIPKVDKALSSRALDAKQYLEMLNREWQPLLSQLRTSVVALVTAGNKLPVTVTGSRGGNAALASLLSGLALVGIIEDHSTP